MDDRRAQVERAADERSSWLGELWAFLRDNKRWWLAPVVIAIVALGALVLLGSTGAGPLVYTLF